LKNISSRTIQKNNIMGRGDKRTRKGKTFKGSFGNSRPQKVKKTTVAAVVAAPAKKATKAKAAKAETATEEKKVAKRAPAKKAAAKKSDAAE
jgi:ribosomal small subunit protein bTHX